MRTFSLLAVKVIHAFSSLVPRDRTRYVCIGWHKTADGEVFADNAKYFFLFLSTQPAIRPVWLAKSRKLAAELRHHGLESVYVHSLRGLWHALRAGWYVIDAFLQPQDYALSGQAKIIQLLHGKGMKKKGYGEAQQRPQDHIFAPSPLAFEMLPASFKAGAKTHVAGYSRNDVFYGKIAQAEIGIDAAMQAHLNELRARGIPTILYAPTFRRGEKTFSFQGLDLDALEVWAKSKGAHVLVNLHNKYRAQQTKPHIGEHLSFLRESDIYPLFPQIDVLVTDYSSSFADFLLLDRPLVFYPYDLESYQVNEGLAADYDTITPGPKAYTFHELLTRLEEALTTKGADWAAERKRVRDLYHTHQDGRSSERIWEALQTDRS